VDQAALTGRFKLGIVGVCCAAVAIVLMFKRPKTRRIQAVLMFVTGLSLAGVAGVARAYLADWYSSGSMSLTGWLFGIGVPYAIALVLVIWFVLDMDLDGLINKARKTGATNKHKASAFTPWLGLIVPVALGALPYVGGLPDAIVAQIG
jgi:uncharacterized membrane protein (DUF485 family)